MESDSGVPDLYREFTPGLANFLVEIGLIIYRYL